MLAAVIIWAYILGLSYVYGSVLINWSMSGMYFRDEQPAKALINLAGLVFLTVLASFFTLFSSINWIIHLLLIVGAVGAVLKKDVGQPKFQVSITGAALLIFSLVIMIVLENGTHRPVNPDTNIYHAQAIRWIESYPVVQGLGNLHGRLAFNSAWFVTNALFSFSFLNLRSFHLVPGILFLIFVVYCWDGFQKILRREYSLSVLIKTAYIPLAFSQLGAEISSPGTDLPANLFVWLVVLLWVENIEKPRPFYPMLIVIFASFAVIIKFSTIPILLLTFLILWEAVRKQGKRQVFLLATCGVIIFLPFILRNIILSGYLVYPFPALDLFSVDWKVPFSRAEEERLSILAWARRPNQDSEQVLALKFTEWFPAWWADQTANRKGILAAGLFSVFTTVPGWWVNRYLRMPRAVWLVMYFGTLFWLVSAPDFRFGYGFLVATILLAGLPWVMFILERVKPVAFAIPGVLYVSLVIFLVFTLIRSVDMKTLPDRIILPTDYDHVPTETCNLANGKVQCAKAYNACSYFEFPCIPNPRPHVELRGKTLEEGFRTIK